MKMESFSGHGSELLFFAAGRILYLNEIKSCCSALSTVAHPEFAVLLRGV
jgi:hypothetical protein